MPKREKTKRRYQLVKEIYDCLSRSDKPLTSEQVAECVLGCAPTAPEWFEIAGVLDMMNNVKRVNMPALGKVGYLTATLFETLERQGAIGPKKTQQLSLYHFVKDYIDKQGRIAWPEA